MGINDMRKDFKQETAKNERLSKQIRDLDHALQDLKVKNIRLVEQIEEFQKHDRGHQLEMLSCLSHLDANSAEDVKGKIRWDVIMNMPELKHKYWKVNTLSMWLIIVAVILLLIAIVAVTYTCCYKRKYKNGKKAAFGGEELALSIVDNMYKKHQSNQYIEAGDELNSVGF